MFADFTHFQSLSESHFGGTLIGHNGDESGNMGSDWNYGNNFGGGGVEYSTVHNGGVGMFGKSAVDAPQNWPQAHECDKLGQHDYSGLGGDVQGHHVVDWCKQGGWESADIDWVHMIGKDGGFA